MTEITAVEKFKMIDKDLAYMKKVFPVGKMTQEFADYKISVYEAIRADLQKATQGILDYEE